MLVYSVDIGWQRQTTCRHSSLQRPLNNDVFWELALIVSGHVMTSVQIVIKGFQLLKRVYTPFPDIGMIVPVVSSDPTVHPEPSVQRWKYVLFSMYGVPRCE